MNAACGVVGVTPGTHKFALGEFFRAYHLSPKHPMISLCIGLTYLAQVTSSFSPFSRVSSLMAAVMNSFVNIISTSIQQVMNRRRPERHYMVLQAFTFLYQYHFLREDDNPQEAAYNVGR
jgi:hypothetical protein